MKFKAYDISLHPTTVLLDHRALYLISGMILTVIATVRLRHLFAFVAQTHLIAVFLSRDGLDFIYLVYA